MLAGNLFLFQGIHLKYLSTRAGVRFAAIVCLCCFALESAYGEWIGAETALKQIKQDPGVEPADQDETTTSDSQKLAGDIKAFGNESAGLDPGEAARRWLSLLDRLVAVLDKQAAVVDPYDRGMRMGMGFGGFYSSQSAADLPTFTGLIKVLPGPASWDAIRLGVEARPIRDEHAVRDRALRMWVSILDGDLESVRSEADEIATLLQTGNAMHDFRMQKHELDKLGEYLGNAKGVGLGSVRAFEAELAQVQAGMTHWLEVPDLVNLIGEEQTRPLLLRAMGAKLPMLSIRGDQTRELARRLVIEHIDQINTPAWGLVDSIDSVAMYEVLAEKFLPNQGRPDTPEPAVRGIDASEQDGQATEQAQDDAPKPRSGLGIFGMARGFGAAMAGGLTGSQYNPYESYDYADARRFYIYGLIAQGRAEDARLELMTSRGTEEWELSVPYQILYELDQAGFAQEVYDFLHLVLSDRLDLPVWEAFSELAARLNKTDELVVLASQAAKDDSLTDLERREVQHLLIKSYIADDRLDESLTMLRELLDEQPEDYRTLNTLLELGIALDDQAILAEVIDRGRDVAVKASGPQFDEDYCVAVIRAYAGLGRYAEAESFLIEFIANCRAGSEVAGVGAVRYGLGEYEIVGPGVQMLMVVYHLADRHEDVRHLLDHWEGWDEKDLLDLEFDYGMRSLLNEKQALVVAGRALLETGETQAAGQAALAAIYSRRGSDPAYQLFIDAVGEAALPKLDELFAMDPYEERPLIWKATVLAESGRLDEAEEAVKRAIGIDPSDGEQGRGDRMRAYRVLGRIAEARGDTEQVEFLARVDDAIRLSEDADRVYAAGMYKRGLEMYKRSLTLFADAYCIQSRLAVQLAEQGRHDEAEQYYQRAYELMPDSFGRVESHCFGCEGVFSGEQAQGIAERVFTRLIEERPDSPQVHYLMGYLRESQDDLEGAIPHYQRAVELDPAYFNAWENLADAARESGAPLALRNQAYLNMVRLDPIRRRVRYAFTYVTDLRGLWRVLESNQNAYTPGPESVYRLHAAAARLEQLEKLSGGEIEYRTSGYWPHIRDFSGASPAEVLAMHEAVRIAASLVDP